MFWRLTKKLAFWALLVWGLATGIVMFCFWVAAKCGCLPEFNFFRGWGIFYLLSVIAPILITLGHFDWWGEGKIPPHADEDEEEAETEGRAATGAPQGGGS